MARTQAADYDQKRDTITEQATQLFARKGFAETSIADLAAQCRVSKSLIYHYYHSKEDILFDVMVGHMDELVGVVDAVVGRSDPPEETFRNLSRELLRRYIGAADRQKVLLYELDSLPAPQRSEIVSKQRHVIEKVEALLIACAPGVARAPHRLRAQTMLYFGMINWTHTWYNNSGKVSRNQLADMAADAALSLLSGAPAEKARRGRKQ